MYLCLWMYIFVCSLRQSIFVRMLLYVYVSVTFVLLLVFASPYEIMQNMGMHLYTCIYYIIVTIFVYYWYNIGQVYVLFRNSLSVAQVQYLYSIWLVRNDIACIVIMQVQHWHSSAQMQYTCGIGLAYNSNVYNIGWYIFSMGLQYWYSICTVLQYPHNIGISYVQCMYSVDIVQIQFTSNIDIISLNYWYSILIICQVKNRYRI